MEIINILNELKATNSTKEKQNILKNNIGNDTLFNVLKYAYDNITYTYGITSETMLKFPTEDKSSLSLDCILEQLNERKVTGHKALELAKSYYNSLTSEYAQLFCNIIDRDLKIGVNSKTLNKIWKNMIPKPNYCRCDVLTSKSKMTFPAFVQLKCDGTYREAYVHNGNVTFKTRSGEPYQNPILSEIMKDLPNGYYIGEFTIGKADNPSLNRSEGNGLINSDNPPYDKIHFTVWDYLEEDVYALKKHVPYSSRLSSLQFNLLNIKSELIQVVPTHIVKSIDEALDKVSQWMNDGLEGGILKSFETRFKNGTSKEQLKIKLKVDADLRCVGFVKGSKGTKYENKNKVILFESDDKKIKGQCSGMTDSQVDEVTKNPTDYIGKIISVEFNDLTKAQGNDYFALSHPRFIEFRNDKTDTDTLEKVIKLRDMAKNIKS